MKKGAVAKTNRGRVRGRARMDRVTAVAGGTGVRNTAGWMIGMLIKGSKERGEWAELCFMTRAAGYGMGVMKPFGDSRTYDVAVEAGRRLLRVQVRSTIYRRRGREYSLNMMGPGRKRFAPGSVDFFAVYLIPEDQWYIIPYAAMGKKMTLHITPGSKRNKYAKYLEAWELLMEEEAREDRVRAHRSLRAGV